MPDGPPISPYDPLKMLPVLFMLCTISGLYLIYVCAHCLPMLQLTAPPNQVDESMRFRGMVELIIFHLITIMLVLCYVRCVLVYPGGVPDQDWWYPTAAVKNVTTPYVERFMHERKANGELRNCRRCWKYKPDRCHHCNVCGVCILKMDHHCPWIFNCVGYHNYKFFFLLLFYTMLDTQMMLWTMPESLIRAVDENAPFMQMFFLMFGLSLCFLMGTALTLFWAFHVWLMLQGMTTIEFCEKKGVAQNPANFESIYSIGLIGNMQNTLGQNPLAWLLPIAIEGDGVSFQTNVNPAMMYTGRDLEPGRGSPRKESSRKLLQAPAQDYGSMVYNTPVHYQRPQREQRPPSGPCVR